MCFANFWLCAEAVTFILSMLVFSARESSLWRRERIPCYHCLGDEGIAKMRQKKKNEIADESSLSSIDVLARLPRNVSQRAQLKTSRNNVSSRLDHIKEIFSAMHLSSPPIVSPFFCYLHLHLSCLHIPLTDV